MKQTTNASVTDRENDQRILDESHLSCKTRDEKFTLFSRLTIHFTRHLALLLVNPSYRPTLFLNFRSKAKLFVCYSRPPASLSSPKRSNYPTPQLGYASSSLRVFALTLQHRPRPHLLRTDNR